MVIFLPEYSFALIVTLHFKDFPSLKCAVTVVVPIFLPVIFPQCHLDSVFYNENSISYSVMH